LVAVVETVLPHKAQLGLVEWFSQASREVQWSIRHSADLDDCAIANVTVRRLADFIVAEHRDVNARPDLKVEW